MIGLTYWKRSSTEKNRKNNPRVSTLFFIAPLLLFNFGYVFADGWLPGPNSNVSDGSSSEIGSDNTKAQNQILNNTVSGKASSGFRTGGIANTRHNLTMSYNSVANSDTAPGMDDYRNNYYEICVYCHTPHGANSTAAAPLWNRTVTQRTYTLYKDASLGRQEPTAQDLNYTQPGPNSLTCLSCHDGATAIDSIINMPTQLTGEFRKEDYATKNAAGYSQLAETDNGSPDLIAFLDTWKDNKLEDAGKNAGSAADPTGQGHAGFNSNSGGGNPCITCHNPQVAAVGPDFKILSIGDQYTGGGGFNQGGVGADGKWVDGKRDLTSRLTAREGFLADDHPIGVEYPKEFGSAVDYREPDVKMPKIAFFDNNGNGHADPNEVRLYDSGDGYEVECGSCHDPHGIKVSTANKNDIIPSFLRVGSYITTGDLDRVDNASGLQIKLSSNSGSSLCLTCHVK